VKVTSIYQSLKKDVIFKSLGLSAEKSEESKVPPPAKIDSMKSKKRKR